MGKIIRLTVTIAMIETWMIVWTTENEPQPFWRCVAAGQFIPVLGKVWQR